MLAADTSGYVRLAPATLPAPVFFVVAAPEYALRLIYAPPAFLQSELSACAAVSRARVARRSR
jgi:hypothetical protein